MKHLKDKDFVEKLVEHIKQKAQEEFGYCGIAEGDNMKMINTGNGNVVIKIKFEEN